MFELWKLKWLLWKIYRTTASEKKKLKATNASHYDFQFVEASEQDAVQDTENHYAFQVGQKLRHKAVRLDVEIPPTTDLTMWVDDTRDSGFMWFTSKGRAHVRRLVDAEKTRRFEARTLWLTRIILPFAGLLIGIIGAFTGCFAVMHKSIPAPEQKPPAYERVLDVKTQQAARDQLWNEGRVVRRDTSCCKFACTSCRELEEWPKERVLPRCP